MRLKREDALKTISDGIAWLVSQCKIRGPMHHFDANTVSHQFYCRFLNELHDLNLVVLDRLSPNFPAIDLGDESAKRAFQITADKSSEKIQSTIDTYAKHDL